LVPTRVQFYPKVKPCFTLLPLRSSLLARCAAFRGGLSEKPAPFRVRRACGGLRYPYARFAAFKAASRRKGVGVAADPAASLRRLRRRGSSVKTGLPWSIRRPLFGIKGAPPPLLNLVSLVYKDDRESGRGCPA
jgi:hypothetical protein